MVCWVTIGVDTEVGEGGSGGDWWYYGGEVWRLQWDVGWRLEACAYQLFDEMIK